MAYKKQLFVDGDVLTASHLNTIEQGIVDNETALSTAATQAADATAKVTEIETQVATNTTNISKKQDTLVSGTNIKTINGSSLLGSGNLTIAGGSGGTTDVQTTTSAYALEIADENGNVILRIDNAGNIITKNFDSSNIIAKCS